MPRPFTYVEDQGNTADAAGSRPASAESSTPATGIPPAPVPPVQPSTPTPRSNRREVPPGPHVPQGALAPVGRPIIKSGIPRIRKHTRAAEAALAVPLNAGGEPAVRCYKYVPVTSASRKRPADFEFQGDDFKRARLGGGVPAGLEVHVYAPVGWSLPDDLVVVRKSSLPGYQGEPAPPTTTGRHVHFQSEREQSVSTLHDSDDEGIARGLLELQQQQKAARAARAARAAHQEDERMKDRQIQESAPVASAPVIDPVDDDSDGSSLSDLDGYSDSEASSSESQVGDDDTEDMVDNEEDSTLVEDEEESGDENGDEDDDDEDDEEEDDEEMSDYDEEEFEDDSEDEDEDCDDPRDLDYVP